MNKDRYQSRSVRRALAFLNSPLVQPMKICPDITEKNADWEVTNQIKETNHSRGAMCIYIILHYNKSNKYSLYMITKTITIDFLVDTILLNM